jgi:hypothetical protein
MSAMHETIECRQVHGVIRAGGRGTRELEGALQEHVRECPACAELLGQGATGSGLGHSLAMLADAEAASELESLDVDRMFGQLEQQLARPPSLVERVRQASTRTRSLALAGIATAIVTLASTTMSQVDFASYPLPHLLGSIAALIAAALAAGAVVLRPIHRRPLPGWLLGVLAGFAVITPGVIASVPTVPHDHPSAQLGIGEQLFTAALSCFTIGMSFALLLVGAAWLVERSGLRRRAAMVLGLVGAGALGNLVLVLHCPIVAPAHKLLGHASISTVLLAAAAGVAWVLIRERRPA